MNKTSNFYKICKAEKKCNLFLLNAKIQRRLSVPYQKKESEKWTKLLFSWKSANLNVVHG
jgi:hypothetical protein